MLYFLSLLFQFVYRSHQSQHRRHPSRFSPSTKRHCRSSWKTQQRTDQLKQTTCSQRYEEDGTIFFGDADTVGKKYKEFAKEFPGWKDPKIKEESPLREYIVATYNKEIAAKYGVQPCPDVPASYFRVLSTIKEQLKTQV